MSFLKKMLAKILPQYYVNPLDQFIMQFDQQHPQRSASQLAEIKKFKRIDYLRDHARSSQKK